MAVRRAFVRRVDVVVRSLASLEDFGSAIGVIISFQVLDAMVAQLATFAGQLSWQHTASSASKRILSMCNRHPIT
jgi:hypothetical protein